MIVHEDKTFQDQSIDISRDIYRNCRFINCEVRAEAGSMAYVIGCVFDGYPIKGRRVTSTPATTS